MKNFFSCLLIACALLSFSELSAVLAGIGKTEITPPIGTPSAGYTDRKGEGMMGIHDPLLAIALFIDNGEKQVVFCSVDHLGFSYEMAQKVTQSVHRELGSDACEIFIGSSHTHSGGGAYLDIPRVGALLAGSYDEKIKDFYIEKTAKAICLACKGAIPAKVGIGYGKTKNLSEYRALWPKEALPLSDVAVIKVSTLDDTPLAVLFNYPVHPTVLSGKNRLFSADFVGYAREKISFLIGKSVQPLYFNGAQGDINPVIFQEDDRFQSCACLGNALAETVKAVWDQIDASDALAIQTQKQSYSFIPKPTPFGPAIPLDSYPTEMNLIVFNQTHAFLTIPGELSSLYDRLLKEKALECGFCHLSIFGLTNDAHGYIILPEAWEHKTKESALSFGGKDYGTSVKNQAELLLEKHSP
jgi:hypothetical protein